MNAYILRIRTQDSYNQARIAAESCANLGVDYKFHLGYTDDVHENAKQLGFNFQIDLEGRSVNAFLCTLSHYAIWKKIYDSKQIGIVLEDDARLITKPPSEIPDGIVCLGYKFAGNGIKAVEQKQTLVKRDRHFGAHAYMLTPQTAKYMLDLKEIYDCIDTVWFRRDIQLEYAEKCPIYVVDPVVAYADCSLSAIQEDGVGEVENYMPLDSFINSNLTTKVNLNAVL